MKVVLFVSSTHFYLSGLCIQHIIKNVKDRIDGIIVMTPKINELKAFHEWLGITGVEYYSDEEICKKLGAPGISLSWTVKQYAILSLDKLFDGDTFLNVDADVLINAPTTFIRGNSRLFVTEKEHYAPYFSTIKDFFGLTKKIMYYESFIADFMVFDRVYLEEMRKDAYPLLDDFDKWINIVEKNTPIDPETNEEGCPAMSEYETYGTWISHKHPEILEFEKSATYFYPMMFYMFQPTEKNLAEHPCIIPMRMTRDYDIDWNAIFPPGWEQFRG